MERSKDRLVRQAGNVVLRLSEPERNLLKILNSALKVSEYTDDVDNIRAYQREEKMLAAMNELFRTTTGLSLVARSLPPAAKAALDGECRDMSVFASVIAPIFEVGRRFKRFNPDKLRSEYGKLVMLLQDMQVSRLRSRLGLGADVVLPVQTVGTALAAAGAEGVLVDPRLEAATELMISAAARGNAKAKEDALKQLIAQYGGDDPEKREIVERCVRSVDDARVFVQLSCEPIRKLQGWLKEMFGGEKPLRSSLAISRGSHGSCLSHSHAEHYSFVSASLHLWHIIQRDMFDFWEVVERDLIGDSASTYRFCDTGQGYHRVSAAPSTGARMQSALAEARALNGGEWVGLSVVHLGDNDVPNALVFIDKYTIIPKLLTPVVSTIESLESIFNNEVDTYPGIRNFLKAKYGSFDDLKQKILGDFFKHAFDGSGDDGGSCIDGRLTSAWNWCSLLHKKDYYDVFVLTGFTGFDAAYA